MHYKFLIVIIVVIVVIIVIIIISKVNADLKNNNNTITIKKQLLSRGAFLYLGEDIGNANRVGTPPGMMCNFLGSSKLRM